AARRPGGYLAARHRGRGGGPAWRERTGSIPLAVAQGIIDRSRAAPRIEALLPAGVPHPPRQVRPILLGLPLAPASPPPAPVTEVRAALIALPEADQVRLGVIEDWKTGPHLLTYRQVEHTHRLVVKALSKDHPDGAPSQILTRTCNDLLEASIP